ncbi:MAG: BMP family ABC transporter substrate-binding protein [Actinocatenispora sp.]
MRRVRGVRLVTVLALGGLSLSLAAGCGKPPAKSSGGSDNGGTYKACMVTDTGGIDDHSFNASAWQGMQDAQKNDSSVDIKNISSSSEQDYEPNLTKFVQADCDLVVGVGGLMSDAVTKVAKANPDQKFAIIDANVDLPNVYSMQFNTAQPSVQAGYLAAAMSKTGKVATYGGINIPPVTIYEDGFAEGVDYYNQQKHKHVKLLGWNEKTQKGVFANSFTDQNKGKSITETFISQGADIVLPVAGGTGLGTAASTSGSNGKQSTIFVDFDGCVSAANYCKTFLTSVTKGIAGAVQKAVEAGQKGQALKGSYIGDLGNKGVGLAPYHDFDSKVPAALKTEVDQVGADIAAGKITIKSKAQPK